MDKALRDDLASMLRTQFRVSGNMGTLIPSDSHIQETVNRIASLIAHHNNLKLDEAERAGMIHRSNQTSAAPRHPDWRSGSIGGGGVKA